MHKVTVETRIIEIKLRHKMYVDEIDGISETTIEMINIEDVAEVPTVHGLFNQMYEENIVEETIIEANVVVPL